MSAASVEQSTPGVRAGGSRTLLTISGVVPVDIRQRVADGRAPQPDYLALAQAMNAELLDVAEARRRAGILGRLIQRLGGRGPLLAWVCFRQHRRYDVIVTDGEQVGLPLALLWLVTRRRSCTHVMIAHILSVRKKVLLVRLFRLRRNIDRILVYASWQQRFIHEALGFREDQVVLTPFMVDTAFFDRDRLPEVEPERMICSAGLERRDYTTLIEAVRGLDVQVVIAAASPWSKQADATAGAQLPPNVEVRNLGFVDLRRLYAAAMFVVMPLHDVEFQAGVTTILEAMAMGKAVISSRTRGQTDVIEPGRTGIYVPPGDAGALRSAISGLLDDAARVRCLGDAARSYVERVCDVSVYAERFGALVGEAQKGTV
jgi:glycosyltransferase involved in cell wall biosynthesis